MIILRKWRCRIYHLASYPYVVQNLNQAQTQGRTEVKGVVQIESKKCLEIKQYAKLYYVFGPLLLNPKSDLFHSKGALVEMQYLARLSFSEEQRCRI